MTPFCTKCNDVFRPGFKLDCKECKLYEQGPGSHKISYEEMKDSLDFLMRLQKPSITEEDRFACRLKYLSALYSRGWTEDDWEKAVLQEYFTGKLETK